MAQAYRPDMKKMISGAIMALMICSLPALGGDEFRDFEDMGGQIIRGKVVAFDTVQEIVSFLRESDGAIKKVKLTIFSQPDRLYIRDWAFVNDVTNNLKFTATVSSVLKSRSDDAVDGTMHREVNTDGYDILIENNSGQDIGRIKLEYCMFYRQGLRTSEGMMYEEGVYHGGEEVDLDPSSKQGSFKTQTVDLYTQQSPGNFFGNLNEAKSDMQGIWIKARISKPSGEQFDYEFLSSNGSKWKWSTRTVGAGLNK